MHPELKDEFENAKWAIFPNPCRWGEQCVPGRGVREMPHFWNRWSRLFCTKLSSQSLVEEVDIWLWAFGQKEPLKALLEIPGRRGRRPQRGQVRAA